MIRRLWRHFATGVRVRLRRTRQPAVRWSGRGGIAERPLEPWELEHPRHEARANFWAPTWPRRVPDDWSPGRRRPRTER